MELGTPRTEKHSRKSRGKSQTRFISCNCDLGHVQTWCPGSVLGHGHQCERSILVVPVQKLEHGTQVWALSLKVVFRHRTQVCALVCTRFHQCRHFTMSFTHDSL